MYNYLSSNENFGNKNKHLLQIYIDSDCFSCQETKLIAEELVKHFPQVATQVINLSDPVSIKPDIVFAVPTYVLDGKIVFLGNPYRDELYAKIVSMLSSESL